MCGLGLLSLPKGPASRTIALIAEEFSIARAILLQRLFQNFPRLFLLARFLIHPLFRVAAKRKQPRSLLGCESISGLPRTCGATLHDGFYADSRRLSGLMANRCCRPWTISSLTTYFPPCCCS